MPTPVEDFTLGVEEEYQIVNPETSELRPRAGRILPRAREAVGEAVSNELFLSQIEVGTPVCRTLAEVRAELVRLRRGLIEAAGREGSRIAAAGTHPFSSWEDQAITPKARYLGIAEDYQQLAREQIIFGCHVHVGIADREAAIRVMNRVRPWLAPMVALAANSPFWQGVDTGYASYRTELFQRFPTVNTPYRPRLARRVRRGRRVAGGRRDDRGRLEDLLGRAPVLALRDARISGRRRLPDDRRGRHDRGPLAVAGPDLPGAGPPRRPDRPPSPRVAPRREVARLALRARRRPHRRPGPPCRPGGRDDRDLARLPPSRAGGAGEWDEVSALVGQTLRRGNGATRQRAAHARAGRFEDVVDLIIEETARGT